MDERPTPPPASAEDYGAAEAAETVETAETNGQGFDAVAEFTVPVEPEAKPNGDAAALGEWDAGDDDAPIPPRGWLLGNVFCRRFVSSLLAEGGAGKTALRVAQGLALATGRPITGEHVFQRCRVLIVSLEDDKDELRRRVRAAMLHHGISQDDVLGLSAGQVTQHFDLTVRQRRGPCRTCRPDLRSG